MSDYKHTHNWYVAQVKSSFEPYNTVGGRMTYTLAEYAFLVCTVCGAAQKSEVTKGKGSDE